MKSLPLTAAGSMMAAAALIVSVGVGLGVVISPLWTSLISVSAVFVFTAAAAPKALSALALILIVFSGTLEVLVPLPGVSFVDEAVIFACATCFTVRRLAAGELPRLPPGTGWFGAFVLAGLLANWQNSVPLTISAAGFAVSAKAILFGLALAQLDWRPGDVVRIFRLLTIVTVSIVGMAILNLMWPAWWMARFAPGWPGETNFGLSALIGPFSRPAALGRFLALMAIALLGVSVAARRRGRYLVAATVLATLAILTFRTKTLLSLLVAGIVVGRRRVGAATRLLLVPAAALGALAVGGQVLQFVGSDFTRYASEGSARYRISIGAIKIATDHFPFGVGFGRYASSVAADHYSPEYVRLGFASIWGLQPPLSGNGDFLSDTAWPAILGESGLVGLTCFGLGLFIIAIGFKRASYSSVSEIHILGLVGLGWTSVTLIESLAAPVFSSAPSYPFLFALSGVLYAVQLGTTTEGNLPEGGALNPPPPTVVRSANKI